MEEGGEELVEYVADYVVDVVSDLIYKGEIQTDFDISEMFQNALTGAIVGGGFGAINASSEIASTAKDIVEAVKNSKTIEKAQAQTEAQEQVQSALEGTQEQAANIKAEGQTGLKGPFASEADTNETQALSQTGTLSETQETAFERGRAEATRPLTQEEVQEIKKGARTITDADGNTYIDIQSDILANVAPQNWVAKIKNVIRSVFPKGFYINGEHIDVSAKSRGEFTSSVESRYLRSIEPEVFNDKMKTAPYLDVISQNAQYQNEVPTHKRTDNIVNFERGKIDLKINNNDYTADVLIGIRKDGTKMFYDIPSMNKKTAPIIGPQSAQTANTEAQEPFNDIPSNNSIPNLEEDVNKALKAEEGNFLEQRGESAKIEPEEEAAVLDYKSSLAYILNEKLRNNIELSSEEKNAVNSLDKALSKMPKYRGTVYRNIGFDIQGQEAFNEFAKSYLEGEIVKYPAYTSASKVQNGYEIEDHLRAHFEIIGKNCRDTEGFGSGAEAEVIFSRNSRFKVIFSEIKDGTVNIKLEEIENGNGLLEGQVPHDTLHGGAALLEMQAPGERRRSSSEMRGIPGGDTAGDIGREAGPQAAASGGPRDTVRTEGRGIEEGAGAKSAGFFDGEKAKTEAPGKTEDKYAPFYKKGAKPEGNTVGAKESTTQFWTSGVQYGTHEPKTRQTYEGNELFEAPQRLSDDGTKEVSQAVESVAASPIGTRETLDYMIQNIDKFTHAVDTDIDSVNKAKSYLETNGIESAMKYWKDISEGKQKYTKDDGVLAATTIRLLQEQGRQAEANRMTAEQRA